MDIYFPIYAVLLFVGGIIGFKKAGSKVSLYAGVISGIVVGAGVYMQSYELIAIVSLLLTGSFGVRLMKTKKMMPAGLLFVLSIISTTLSLLKVIG